MSLRHWRDLPGARNVDWFYCDCCQNYLQADHSPNRQCLVRDNKVVEIYCRYCFKSHIFEQCRFCNK